MRCCLWQVSPSFIQLMDTYGLQPTNPHAGHAYDSGLWPEQHLRYPVHLSEPEPPHSTDSSHNSYHTANTSPLSHLTTNSTSTLSSNISFPFSVTSINSRKSRKNVLYPRRVHPLPPLPVPVASGHPVSPDPLAWQVRFLCTTLLPCSETRLVPAGEVLLQSLGLHGDFSQRVPARTDEETRCCAELFIALTHDVLLKDAVGAGELEGPCKLLHTTFKDILFKLEAFSLPATRKLNEAGLNAPSAGALALEQFSRVLCELSSVMNAFEGSLNSAKATATKEEALGDHFRVALMGLSVSTGLTMEQYRKKLDQSLAQTQTQLNSLLVQQEGPLPRPKSITPVIQPRKGAAHRISTISERSEEGSSANGHTRSHSIQQGIQRRSDGKHSLPRRILRGLIQLGKKEVPV